MKALGSYFQCQQPLNNYGLLLSVFMIHWHRGVFLSYAEYHNLWNAWAVQNIIKVVNHAQLQFTLPKYWLSTVAFQALHFSCTIIIKFVQNALCTGCPAIKIYRYIRVIKARRKGFGLFHANKVFFSSVSLLIECYKLYYFRDSIIAQHLFVVANQKKIRTFWHSMKCTINVEKVDIIN